MYILMLACFVFFLRFTSPYFLSFHSITFCNSRPLSRTLALNFYIAALPKTLLNKCFQKKWSMASYERAVTELNLLPTLSSELLETFPRTYSAKTVSLSKVEDSCNLYSDDSDQCSIAVSNYQFIFIGDVNAESKTLQVIHGLANN